MGYYASYSGYLLANRIPDDVRKSLRELEDFKITEPAEPGNNNVELCFDGFDKFYIEGWEGKDGFLELVQPYTISGEIIFAGEDDTFWSYKYDQNKHGFVFGRGEIVYQYDEEVMKYE